MGYYEDSLDAAVQAASNAAQAARVNKPAIDAMAVQVGISAGVASDAQAAAASSASSAAASATAAANSAALVGAPADSAIAATFGAASASRNAGDKRWRVGASLLDYTAPTGTNDTANVNAALASFAASGGGLLRIPAGTWKFTGSTGVALSSASSIRIEAEPGAVFDFTASTAPTAITLGGSAGSSAPLGADAAKFATTITCSLTPAAGDILRIQSTDVFEPVMNTPKGELVEVASVAGGVITLKSSLYDSYTAATTTVTALTMPSVAVKGLTIKRNSNHAALLIEYARDVLVSDVTATGARDRLIYLSRVYQGTIENCHGTDFYFSGSGTSYGIVVGSCQGIIERGNFMRGGRHAVSHGGVDFPCRNVLMEGGVYDNQHSSGQASVDFHPNCENVRMVGVVALNGVISTASNFAADGCTARGDNRAGFEVYASRSCDYISIKGAKIHTNTDVGITFTPRNAVAAAHTIKTVEFDGVIRAGFTGISIAPATASDGNATIDRLYISGDIESGGVGNGVTITKSGTAAVTINETNVSARVRSPGGNGFVNAGAASGQARFLGGKLSSGKVNGSAYNSPTGFTDVFMRDTVLEATNTPFRSVFGNTGKTHLRGITVIGASGAGGIEATACAEVLIESPAFLSAPGTPLVPARVLDSLSWQGKARSTGTAAPTAGTWAVGDEVRNSVPAVGSPKGWVCTVAGTPGTWVSVGNL